MTTQLVAATLAHYGVLAHGPARPKKTLPPMADTSRTGGGGYSDRDWLKIPF
jgi:hypothetical protein